MLRCTNVSALLGWQRRQTPLVAQIMELAKEYLASAGSGRTMAAVLMARLLTRPDQAAELSTFVAWALDRLQTQGVEGSFIVPGLCCLLNASRCTCRSSRWQQH